MYFIGGVGGGCPSRGQYPRAAKNSLTPPPSLNLALGAFRQDIRFPRTPPPPWGGGSGIDKEKRIGAAAT